MVSGVVRRLTGWIPFSLMELGIAAIVIGVAAGLVLLVVSLVKGIRTKQIPGKAIGRVLYIIVCTASVFYFVFVVFCGANYHRNTFAESTGLVVRDSSANELFEVVVSLADEARALRAELAESEEGVVKSPFASYGAMADAVREAYTACGKDYEVLSQWVPRPKRVLFSEIMSMTETTGIYCVYTAEANINRHILDFRKPAVMAHELAHLQGFMREDEANFIAYLVTQYSNDPFVRYSGVMFALSYAGNQLYAADYDLWVESRSHYSAQMNADNAASAAFWEPYRDTKIAEKADQANTTYLKAQGQSDGTKSYGRMVDLLLAFYRSTEVE